MRETDFLIVGGGIAGAGLAYFLSAHGRTTILEMEDQLGYHTTGRSAAFLAETYGGLAVQPLTSASKAFFMNPPEGFSDVPLIVPMGAVHIFDAARNEQAEALADELKAAIDHVRLLSRDEVLSKAPYLANSDIIGGIDDADCGALDVAALHQGYLRGAKAHGTDILVGARLESAVFRDGLWHIETRKGPVRAKKLVNAAGAWADDVAERAGIKPIGIQPLRRTIITVPNPANIEFKTGGPMVLDLDERYYFKPEGNGYLVSPADETPSEATDAQPEMEDVALAAHYFEEVSGAPVKHIESKWAGLRSFSKDRKPVIGHDPDNNAFFWNVGQGGFGIQTSPAWSQLSTNLILGLAPQDEFLTQGGKVTLYDPARFKS